MKFISLVILVIQNVSLILGISYVWTLSDFLATSAVVMAEILKVLTCLFIISMQRTGELNSAGHRPSRTEFGHPWCDVTVVIRCSI
uniref:Si:dkey-83k24.5 n=1 Tax=Sinocyclocheilus anshuiensis TaxID=1608454 RepID=A0A671QL27_9TELE